MLLLSPVVNYVSPVSGLTTGGTEVTITGSNFIENLTGPDTGTRVKFGSLNAASVTVISDTRLIATTPPVASPGPVSITVSNAHINPVWLDVTLANAFTYNSPEPILETDLTLAFGDSITLWHDVGDLRPQSQLLLHARRPPTRHIRRVCATCCARAIRSRRTSTW